MGTHVGCWFLNASLCTDLLLITWQQSDILAAPSLWQDAAPAPSLPQPQHRALRSGEDLVNGWSAVTVMGTWCTQRGRADGWRLQP